MSKVEATFRRYIAIYDGTKKDFQEEAEPFYDELFHTKFTLTTKPMKEDHHDKFDLHFRHGKTLTREESKASHANHLAIGTKITIIHFKFKQVSPFIVDVKFNLKNDLEDKDIRVVYSVEDDKLLTGQEVEDSFFSVAKAKSSRRLQFFNHTLKEHLTNK
jgi:hypothetical protein